MCVTCVAHWDVCSVYCVAHWGIRVAHWVKCLALWGICVAHWGICVAHWGLCVAHWGICIAHWLHTWLRSQFNSGSNPGILPNTYCTVLGVKKNWDG